MGAFPEYKLTITRRGPRLHIEVDHFTEGPVACGSAPADWLVRVGYEDGAEWSVPMTEAQLCSTEHPWARGYVCPQCGPDPAGPDRHAETHHTWPPGGE